MTNRSRIFRPRFEDIFDWGGGQLMPHIRDAFGVGNIVRIQVEENPQPGWVDTPYVRISGASEDGTFVGVVEDPYRDDSYETSMVMCSLSTVLT